jgi:diguanylate cyclase (GGDEF)-like protein/PAS domain S-box-containing protein
MNNMNAQPNDENLALLEIRSFWDHLPTEVYLLDPRTCQIIDANNRACANMQYTREEFQRLSPVDISPSYTPEFLTQAGIPLSEDTSEDVVFEIERRRKDSSLYWAEVRVARIRAGGQAMMTSIVTDITARKRVQDELVETRERLLRMVMTVDMGAWEWNVETNEVLHCPTVHRLLGCAPDVAVRSLDDLLLHIMADDREVVRTTAQQCATDGVVRRIEYRVPGLDGEVRWLAASCRAIADPSGGYTKILGVLIDVTDQKTRQIALSENEEHFRSTFERAAVGIAHAAPDGKITRVNNKMCDILGYSREELLNLPFQQITHPDDLQTNLGLQNDLLSGKIDTYTMEKRLIRKDGVAVWTNRTMSISRNADGSPRHVIAVIEDINDRKRLEAELRESEQRFRLAVENAPIGKGLVSLDGRWLQANPALCQLTGYTEQELLALNFKDITHPDDREKDRHLLEQFFAGLLSTYTIEKRYIHRDGHEIETLLSVTLVRDDHGQRLYHIVQVQDITDRKRNERRLAYLAQHDSLTGLPNRSLFHERVVQAMERTRHSKTPMALMYLDIDYFKQINDSLGHGAGDALLTGFAARLKASVRDGDTVARLGGDEFTVLIQELQKEDDAQTVAMNILRNVAREFQVAGEPIKVTTSIGIALYRGEDASHDKLLTRADKALYQAKKAGRNTFRFAHFPAQTEPAGNPDKAQGDWASAAKPAAPRVPPDIAAGTASAGQPTIADFMVTNAAASNGAVGNFLADAVGVMREHLQMDVAFISEFTAGRRELRYVDSATGNPPLQVGASAPLEESYCIRVVDGRLPELIPDAFELPAALELPATTALPVRAHVSVPIRLQDGSIYGTFCCFSHTPDPSLNQRDLEMMKVFADLTARQIDKEKRTDEAYDEKRTRIQSLLSNDALTIVYQPICDVGQGRIVGFEALSRFAAEPKRTPDVWYAEAASVGLGIELEIRAIEKALAGLDALPPDVYVSLNASPETLISGELERVLERAPHERIVLEITEHNFINEYLAVDDMLRPLRALGVRVAVDDAGAGYASFRHILQLAPDLIKLDMSITRAIDSNSSCRALASALLRFALETKSVLVAEGVETAAELQTLQSLGVTHVQGYLLGRPAPLDSAVHACRSGIQLPKQDLP